MNSLKNYLKSFVIFQTWWGIIFFLFWFLLSFIPTGVNEFYEPVFKQLNTSPKELIFFGSVNVVISLLFCLIHIKEPLGKQIKFKKFLINLGWCIVIVGSFLFLIDLLPSSYGNIDLSLIQIILAMLFVPPVLAFVSTCSLGE